MSGGRTNKLAAMISLFGGLVFSILFAYYAVVGNLVFTVLYLILMSWFYLAAVMLGTKREKKEAGG